MKELFHQETLAGIFFGFMFSIPLRASLKRKSPTYRAAATVGLIVGLSFLGSSIHDYRAERQRLKQLFLEDYIDKYPDDFPQFKMIDNILHGLKHLKDFDSARDQFWIPKILGNSEVSLQADWILMIDINEIEERKLLKDKLEYWGISRA